MSKRKTVAVNLSVLLPLIKSRFRSNVVFCENMGRPNQKTWVTEWGRGRNLPSPEEAARMCAILQTTPEEILVEPEDIELVRGLIERERAKQSIKKGLPQGEAKISDILDAMTLEELSDVIAAANAKIAQRLKKQEAEQ